MASYSFAYTVDCTLGSSINRTGGHILNAIKCDELWNDELLLYWRAGVDCVIRAMYNMAKPSR